MPSDRTPPLDLERARQILAPAQRAFTAACESALAQSDAWYSTHTASEEERVAHIAAELGPFALGHVDPIRFGALFAKPRALTPLTRDALKKARAALRAMCSRGSVTMVTVPSGGSIAATVDAALAEGGRAFAAARVVEFVRSGRDGSDPVPLLAPLPFHEWTRAERRCAPPLLVSVAGADLHAAALGDFTDGRQKIVLMVEGTCPPAPLVRLVTPGTFVMQTSNDSALDAVASFDGPAVAAIVPESAAAFTHDPAGGAEPWQRLSIQRLPAPPFGSVPGMSMWQLREDLRQLEALAAEPTGQPIPPGAATAANAPDAVDRLTAWLLEQSDLTGLA